MSGSKRHVMFSPSAAATLRLALFNYERSAEVLYPLDNFSFGPIGTDDTKGRIRWVEEELGCSGWQEVTDRSATFLAAFNPPIGPVTAWVSRRETLTYAGFLWWLSHVGEVPISVIEAEKLSILNPERMTEFLDRAVPLSLDLRARYLAQWKRLKIEDAPLRVIEGEELVSARIEHFDNGLLGHATHEWRKMARIVADVLVDFLDAGLFQTCDLVLGARLADLAETGRLEWRGDLSRMQGCDLRLPAATKPMLAFGRNKLLIARQ